MNDYKKERIDNTSTQIQISIHYALIHGVGVNLLTNTQILISATTYLLEVHIRISILAHTTFDMIVGF